jgi:hypothetical protein
MQNKFIYIFIIITIVFLPFRTVQAISFDFIGTIRSALDDIGGIDRTVGVYPFGGEVSDTGSGCVIDYILWAPCPIFTFVICPYPGIAIPLPGSTSFDIDNILPTPGEIFTLPFVSQVLPDNNHVEKDDWALGLGWSPFKPIIDQVNNILGSITIPLPIGFINGLKLECSESDNHVVLIVGSS